MRWEIVFGIVVLAAFVSYVCLLLWVAFQRCVAPTKRMESDSAYELQSILENTDPTCEAALLWQTHSPVLAKLKDAGLRGVSVREIRVLYLSVHAAFPELCEGCTFENWLRTLEHAQAVTREGDTIRITDKGIFILDFVEEQVKCPCEWS